MDGIKIEIQIENTDIDYKNEIECLLNDNEFKAPKLIWCDQSKSDSIEEDDDDFDDYDDSDEYDDADMEMDSLEDTAPSCVNLNNAIIPTSANLSNLNPCESENIELNVLAPSSSNPNNSKEYGQKFESLVTTNANLSNTIISSNVNQYESQVEIKYINNFAPANVNLNTNEYETQKMEIKLLDNFITPSVNLNSVAPSTINLNNGNEFENQNMEIKYIENYVASDINLNSTAKHETQEIEIKSADHLIEETKPAPKGKFNICSYCSKAFTRKSDLTRHERLHTGENLYACNHCDKKFTQQIHLIKHTATKHNNEMNSEENQNTALNLKEDTELANIEIDGIKAFEIKVKKNKEMVRKEIENQTKYDSLGMIKKGNVCSICNREFKGLYNLKRHMRTHTRNYDCSICEEKFDRNVDLIHHTAIHKDKHKQVIKTKPKTEKYEENHEFLKFLQNSSCLSKDEFEDDEAIKMEINDESHSSLKEEYSVEENVSLIKMEMEEEDHELQVSNSSLNDVEDFKKVKIEILDYKEFKFENNSDVEVKPEIIDNKAGNNSTSGVKRNCVCSYCNKEFRTSSCLKRHVRMHTKNYDCAICDIKFTRNCDLVNHVKEYKEKHKELMKCKPKIKSTQAINNDVINESYEPVRYEINEENQSSSSMFYEVSEEDQDELVKIERNEGNQMLTIKELLNEDNVYDKIHQEETSSSTGQDFLNQSEDIEDFKNVKIEIIDNTEIGKKPSINEQQKNIGYPNMAKKSNVCSYCNKEYQTPHSLKRHIRTHTKEYDCYICKVKFTASGELKKHIAEHKKNNITVKKYSCQYCKEKFYQTEELSRHILTHHEKSLRFECIHCEKRFPEKHMLSAHLESHNDEKPCPYCELRFLETFDLTRHMLIHTREMPYKCTSCDQRFKQHDSLTKHLLSHTSETLFTCTICDKKFNDKSSFDGHMVVHEQLLMS